MKMQARAFAPASAGNAIAGFDLLGHSIAGPRDIATVRRVDEPKVRIDAIRGSAVELPMEPEINTAGAALIALREALALPWGFAIELDKGIPFASGMGGSAASCVAALVAANALLDEPMQQTALYPFALTGEAAASGGRHGDNVGPMLLGGLCLSTDTRLISLPVPTGLTAVLVHPDLAIETRAAREVLAGDYPLSAFVRQSSHLAQLMAGLYQGDMDLLRAGLVDVLVEPRRAGLIPGFTRVRCAAMDHGALGAGISGAGPSMLAWFEDEATAAKAAPAMQAAFNEVGLNSQFWVSPVAGPAAELLA